MEWAFLKLILFVLSIQPWSDSLFKHDQLVYDRVLRVKRSHCVRAYNFLSIVPECKPTEPRRVNRHRYARYGGSHNSNRSRFLRRIGIRLRFCLPAKAAKSVFALIAPVVTLVKEAEITVKNKDDSRYVLNSRINSSEGSFSLVLTMQLIDRKACEILKCSKYSP